MKKDGVWQLPVKQSDFTNYHSVHPWSKYHYFFNNIALCDKYVQDTNYFKTNIDEEKIAETPSLACKKCFQMRFRQK